MEQMTNEKMIEDLRNCANVNYEYRADGASCSKCQYKEASYCKRTMMLAAADALESAGKRIAELEARLPKEGEWIWLSSTYDRVPREMIYWCSVCHHEEVVHYERPWKHYCPNCGSRMRKG